MKFLKFFGWIVSGIVLIGGLAYGLLPTIGKMMITQGLTNSGFTNVAININYPSLRTLTIPSLVFRTPATSGATSISIDNTTIHYSLTSLWNNVVEEVVVEHMKIVWNSSLLDTPTAPAPGLPTTQTNSSFPFGSLRSRAKLPILPFKHFRVQQLDVSNPLAPPTLQHITLSAKMDALPKGYDSSVHLHENSLLLNLLTFSLTQDGTLSLTGTHTSDPQDRLLDLKTTLKSSGSSLKLEGKARVKLHPFIHTLTALYPLPPQYQSISGTFSGNWTGAINEQPSSSGSVIGPLQGEFTLEAKAQTWPPFTQEIQLQTQGTVAVVGEEVTVTVQPASSGSATLAMGSFIPPAINAFIRHNNRRSVTWNIREPLHIETSINQALDSIQIPSGKVHMAVSNSSEKLDMLLSPKGLLWTPAIGVSGKAEVNLTTQLKPGPTLTWHPEALLIEADATVTFSPKHIDVAFNPSSYFHFSEMNTETIHVPKIVSRFPQGASATYLPDTKTLIVQTTKSVVSLPSVFLQDQPWTFQTIFTKNLLIRNTPQSWTINGDTTIKKVHAPFDAIKIPDSNWQTRYAVNPSVVTVQFSGQMLEHLARLGGQIKFNLLTGEGTGTMRLKPIQFAPQTLVLSQLIQPWTYPTMDVTHGTVSASAEVTFRKAPNDPDKPFHLSNLNGIVDFKDIGGFSKPTIMEGLTTRVEILGKDETLRIPPTPLRIRNIQSAVELTETALLLSTGTFPQTSIPTLSIMNMSTHLLGGKVFLAEATIDPKAVTHAVTLQVNGLDLNEILRLEQQETVKGTGTLDGTLPLVISRTESGTAITVQQGTIQGREPGGTLQFEVDKETAKSWTESQPQLDLLVKSLENYHYSKLAIGVDYQKNGILTLATQLDGKNPDFRNGVPIHFNLNIEENIPALMKSLSLVKGLEESIENMMAERNTSSTK